MGNHVRAVIALIFTILVWGVSPVFVRSFSLTTGPADAIVIRMCTTAFSTLPLFMYSGWHIEKADIPKLLLVACIGMFGYFLGSIFGYAFVPAGFGSMIIAVQPLLIASIAALIGVDKLNRYSVVGLFISFIGTLYLFGGNSSGEISNSDMLKGGSLLLLCDIGWAIYVIYSKPLLRKYGTFKITAWTLLLCAPPSLIFLSSSTIPSILTLDSQALLSLFFLSVIGTVVCVVSWNFAVPHLSSTTMGASLYLIPVLAVVAGWAALDEKLSLATIIAGSIILTGVAIAEFGSTKKMV
jgi:drug/metabolite transporter (DMT)-like permease